MATSPAQETVQDGLAAGALAAMLSGVPSTVHAQFTGGDPLEASLAAGSMLLPGEERRGRLLAAAVPIHIGLSLGWAVLLSATLPRSRTISCGIITGALIAALDLGVVGRRFPRIRALPVLPQVADHLAFGAVVGAVLRGRRERRATPPRAGRNDPAPTAIRTPVVLSK